MIEATKPFIKILLVLAAVGVLSLTAAYFIGISICPIYNFVGIPCPSCGMSRAWAFTLHGEIGEAHVYHPMFWIVIFLPFLAMKYKHVNAAAVIVLVVFIIVWIARMFFLFPHTEPMTINDRALIFKILNNFDN